MKRDRDGNSDIEDLSHALPSAEYAREFWHVVLFDSKSEHLDTEGLKQAIREFREIKVMS